MIGQHFIKGWSRTQGSITLSSAEAELVAMVKTAAEVMGILAMMKDLDDKGKAVVYADSSAALGIADRKGSGKLRHINIGLLWIQEKQERKEVECKKIKGEANPADLMTKYMTAAKAEAHRTRLNQHLARGRAEAGLKVQGA